MTDDPLGEELFKLEHQLKTDKKDEEARRCHAAKEVMISIPMVPKVFLLSPILYCKLLIPIHAFVCSREKFGTSLHSQFTRNYIPTVYLPVLYV